MLLNSLKTVLLVLFLYSFCGQVEARIIHPFKGNWRGGSYQNIPNNSVWHVEMIVDKEGITKMKYILHPCAASGSLLKFLVTWKDDPGTEWGVCVVGKIRDWQTCEFVNFEACGGFNIAKNWLLLNWKTIDSAGNVLDTGIIGLRRVKLRVQ